MDQSADGALLHNIVLFARVLRHAGVDVTARQVHDLIHACKYLEVNRRAEFRAAARCLLIHRREDLPTFDRAFELFWRPRSYDAAARESAEAFGRALRRAPPRSSFFFAIETGAPALDDHLPPEVKPLYSYSADEVLRHKDFGSFTPDEMADARRFLQELRWRVGARETRRLMRGGRELLDLRTTVRKSLRYGGELVELSRKRNRWKPRQLVVFCDISGSMENYSRLLLHFVHALRTNYTNVETFVFATRLTRITRQLRTRDLETALRQVGSLVGDWSGGTRIGEAIKTFNFTWARRVLRSGAVVLIISDGWDRGEPELLSREMARLKRTVHRLIWLNPLLASPEYQPLTAGLKAALPHTDEFLPAHNLASLEDLAQRLNRLA